MQYRKIMIKIASAFAFVLAATLSAGSLAQMELSPEQKEYMEIQQRLGVAQQQAMRNTPALTKQMEETEELFVEKMRQAGYDPAGIMEVLLSAQEKLDSPDLSAADRQKLMQSKEVVDAQRLWREAQRAIMNDPDVIAAQRELEEGFRAAMRKEEPELDKLISRMQEIQEQSMRQSAPGGR